jgi:cytochrome P450
VTQAPPAPPAPPDNRADPETFDPERFSPERSNDRHRFAYLPFGGGPRLCIGNNMALVQILLIIVTLVRKYDFTLADDRPVNIRPMMLLRPDGPVRMHFRKMQGNPGSATFAKKSLMQKATR